MEKLKEWLSGQYRAGKRWVVLDRTSECRNCPVCYADYTDAAEDCRKKNARGQFYGVRVLASLLKQLNGKIPGPRSGRDIELLRGVVGRYPVHPFKKEAGWEAELLNGNFYPLMREELVHPLLDIQKYAVLRESRCKPIKRQLLDVQGEFLPAMRLLYVHARSIRDKEVSLVLAGLFQDLPIDYLTADLDDGRVSIELYRMDRKNGDGPQIVEMHDPCVPLLRRSAVFVRYHPKERILSFYDGRLRCINRMELPEMIDPEVFDFGELVI